VSSWCERVCSCVQVKNLLRFGVTPVLVLEGTPPTAKWGRLQKRILSR
jgi:hypothetical protein